MSGKPLYSSRKSLPIALAITVVIVLLLQLIPVSINPSDNARIILDHTTEVFIAPACFDEAGATNYLSESTLGDAKKREYAPEGSCTADLLKPTSYPLWRAIGIGIGRLFS